MLSRPSLRLAAAAAALALPGFALAQGAAKADCARLTALGAPQPVWLAGAKSAPGEEALLTLLNYQMALSLCHQEEIIRLLKAQAETKSSPAPASAALPMANLPTANVTASASTELAASPSVAPSPQACAPSSTAP